MMKTLLQNQIQKKPLTELQHFFAGIRGTVEKFPPLLQAEVKLSVANLIGKMELDYL